MGTVCTCVRDHDIESARRLLDECSGGLVVGGVRRRQLHDVELSRVLLHERV